MISLNDVEELKKRDNEPDMKKVGLEEVTLKDLVLALRRKCMHCQRAPRLLRHLREMIFLVDSPNQIIDSDYLFVNEAGDILTLMDNFSSKVYLHFADTPMADNVVQGLMRWRAHFSLQVNFVLVTDNGSHYANKLLEKISAELRIEQLFTVAYAPWTNGITNRINSPILKAIKSLKASTD